MKNFEVTLSLPVSVNRCYWFAGKRKALSQKARQWDNDTCLYLMLIRRQRGITAKEVIFPKGIDLRIECIFYFKDRRRRDASNYLKRLYELVFPKARIIHDDSQFKSEEIITRIADDNSQSYVEVKISEITQY